MEPRVTQVLHMLQFSLLILVTSGVNGRLQNETFPNPTTTQSLSPTANAGNMPTNAPTAVQVPTREYITNSTSPTDQLIPSAATSSHPGTSKASSPPPPSSATVRSGNSTENMKEQEQNRGKKVLITILMLIIVIMLLVCLIHRLMKGRRSSQGGSAYNIIAIRETVMSWLGFPLCKGAGGGEEEEEIEGGQVEDDVVDKRDAEDSVAAVKAAEDSDSSDTSDEEFSPGQDTDRLAGEQPEEERPGSEARPGSEVSEQAAETKAVREEGEGSSPALCAQENNGVEADWCDVTVL